MVTNQTSATGPELTASTTRGPYYVSGTPELPDGNLNYAGLPGEPITITGHVYGKSDRAVPLVGARVEIWHCDSTGVYHPEGSGDASRYTREQIALRGFVVTDHEGAYRFTSIYPGAYRPRARHIHIAASAPGHKGVVTQLMLPAKPGDPVLPQDDMVARSLPPANFLTFTEREGTKSAEFDFYLAPL